MKNITIAAGVVAQDYQGTDTEPRLRIFVTETFVASDSETILRSTFEEGLFYDEHVCFVDAGQVNYPQFLIHSTTDAISNPDNAKYTFCLFTAAGQFIQVVAKRIIVPDDPTTTSLPVLELLSSGPPPAPPSPSNLYYTATQVNALLAAVTLLLATQAEAEAGVNNSHYMTPLRVAEELAALVPSFSFATQAQAEAGTNTSVIMSPLRVAQEIAALVPTFSFATQAEAEAGVITSRVMSPLRTKQAIAIAVAALIGTAPSILDTLGEISDALNDDANAYATLVGLIAAKVSDTAYGAGWDGDTSHAPSKNAVYDKIETILATGFVDDTAYNATTWNGVTSVAPSKNAVRDKFESLGAVPDGEKVWLPAAGVNGTTAAPFWDLPAATAPTPTDIAGSNVHKAVLSFTDAGNSFAETTLLLPVDWTGAVDARIIWYTPATSGNCKWKLATSFADVAASAVDDVAYNTAQSVTTAAPGTANRVQTSLLASLTLTGGAVGDLMHLKISRDGTDGADTIAAAALLVGVELTIRRT